MKKRICCCVLLLAIILLTNAFTSPSKAESAPQPLPFFQDWSDATLIAENDDWSGVPGILGYRGDNLTSAIGADPQTLLADGAEVLDVIANRSDPDTLTTGGVVEYDGIPNPSIALQGSGTADAPFILINISTEGLSQVRMSYVLRDLDGSDDDANSPVALHYRIGTSGEFTNIPEAFVADATSGPDTATQETHVSVTLPAECENRAHLQLRIMTTNSTGSDEPIGIDDIRIFVNHDPQIESPAAADPNPISLGP